MGRAAWLSEMGDTWWPATLRTWICWLWDMVLAQLCTDFLSKSLSAQTAAGVWTLVDASFHQTLFILYLVPFFFLGGDAKLLVILCVSPGQKHVAETLQSLGFGTRARQVKRGQARKKSPHSQIREWCLGSA